MIEKALVKTTKSAFDVQMKITDEELKGKKGISFVRFKGNSVEYIGIPNVPAQTFKFFYNPSKLSNSERQQLREKGLLLVNKEEDLEP